MAGKNVESWEDKVGNSILLFLWSKREDRRLSVDSG